MSGDNELLARLRNEQFAVVDDFLSLEFANKLLRSSQELIKSNAFKQHRFSFGGSLLEKPGVFEIDLSGPTCSKMPSGLGAWNDVVNDFAPSFVKRLAVDNALALKSGTPAIKVQLNTGGGSFPWHYDNPGPPSERSLTCIVYLNPNWTPGDGGELVLWPFLSKQIVVPPLHARAVLFRSDTVLHRVLPSKVRRLCFTMWCPGNAVNRQSDVLLSKDVLQFRSYDEAQAFFCQSPLQRVLSRAVYSEDYLESLLECVENESGHEKISLQLKRSLVQQHENNVNQIMVKLRPLIQEFRERKTRREIS
ncbi:hypothetical protein THAOC_12587 [Thalassiosira oceanica]|uniref:Fe2OG dioxygenase domain-containing protein n=1 Tax=Thalassiosira oceanica TaxID=159749 RepID=K0SJM0_THAOC|nr:hypothetical protein THAOC_12587 [Thalassiosira oceanica]|mmetsp:Transcript_10412/g.24280  ORF Transcript_10412/g.24280 Transcript_10412/m.24280 type:complete len:306 (+) Transcript_10412:321-1238(+)|eukprot:EJK66493.1 hypothetical protein THAOC_12587 [Thalassiosira oceanica]